MLRSDVPRPELIRHFENPRNAGKLADATHDVEVENPACGDILRLWARVEKGRIAAIRYQTRGCTAAIAAGSVLTELVAGKTLAEAGKITADSIDEALGGLPNESKHVARLSMDALRSLLKLAR